MANPAANVTACDSQMPTSKNRSGNSSRTGSSMVPWHMAAVMTTTFASARIAPSTASRTHSVYGGRLASFFNRTIEPFSCRKGAGAWKVVGSSAAGLKP